MSTTAAAIASFGGATGVACAACWAMLWMFSRPRWAVAR